MTPRRYCWSASNRRRWPARSGRLNCLRNRSAQTRLLAASISIPAGGNVVRDIGAAYAGIEKAVLGHRGGTEHVSAIDDDGIVQQLVKFLQVDRAKLFPIGQYQQSVGVFRSLQGGSDVFNVLHAQDLTRVVGPCRIVCLN